MNSEELESLKKKYTVGAEKIEEISKVIYSRLVFEKTPQENPIAIIVGGQPGAGKSGLINRTGIELENSVVLDVDDFRYFHPDIETILRKYPNDLATFTIKFVNDIFKTVFAWLIKDGYNIISQKTLRDDEVIYDTLEPLSKAGYTIVLRVLAVSDLESIMSTIERSLSVKRTTGYCRWTPVDRQLYAYNGLVTTSAHIYASPYCDVVQVFKRNDIPSNSDLVYSESKEDSAEKIALSLKNNPTLNLADYNVGGYADEVDAIETVRERTSVADMDSIKTRLLIAKLAHDDEAPKYISELEDMLTARWLKLNDIDGNYMNNNLKLELAKEVLARKIALQCKDGLDQNNTELMKLLEEEKEMNKFNTFVIDKIINVYGEEVKGDIQKKNGK